MLNTVDHLIFFISVLLFLQIIRNSIHKRKTSIKKLRRKFTKMSCSFRFNCNYDRTIVDKYLYPRKNKDQRSNNDLRPSKFIKCIVFFGIFTKAIFNNKQIGMFYQPNRGLGQQPYKCHNYGLVIKLA